ncbi:hypothetical protein KKB43_00655 [Patescibacteria group bacterium]|nr:hypothetical protein [Patescibacteria group bacterium]MBU4142334.1 hypothetical protein [Patescibacteria group bacterium]MBU4579509.1 hypothetical protein [Patescibacteria group bacterium]
MTNAAIEKILGSILLLIGLAIIGSSIYLGINIFIKVQDPPEIFKPVAVETAPAEPPSKNSSAPMPKNLNEINPDELQKMVSDNLISPEIIKAIIPPEMFNYTSRMMNLTVFSIFLWVLITAGAKIASLGVALIKSNSDIKF